jgi:hypothetical protein
MTVYHLWSVILAYGDDVDDIQKKKHVMNLQVLRISQGDHL